MAVKKTPYLIYIITWCVLACCVVIFPIRCDLSDVFHSRPSTLKERTRPNPGAERSQSGQPAERSQKFQVKIVVSCLQILRKFM